MDKDEIDKMPAADPVSGRFFGIRLVFISVEALIPYFLGIYSMGYLFSSDTLIDNLMQIVMIVLMLASTIAYIVGASAYIGVMCTKYFRNWWSLAYFLFEFAGGALIAYLMNGELKSYLFVPAVINFTGIALFGIAKVATWLVAEFRGDTERGGDKPLPHTRSGIAPSGALYIFIAALFLLGIPAIIFNYVCLERFLLQGPIMYIKIYYNVPLSVVFYISMVIIWIVGWMGDLRRS